MNYAPSSLTVRKIHIDLAQGFAQHWNGNDAFMSAFANALSMSFPEGEQFFIDSVKAGMPHLPRTAENEALHLNIKKFIGQEATHRFFHAQYNAQLEKQGYRNGWQIRIQKRLERVRQRLSSSKVAQPFLHELAFTCAAENLTAIMGEIVLKRQDQEHDWFGKADEPLKTLWRWHAAEECEHKSIAFDLYLRLGGDHPIRMYWFKYFLRTFIYDLTLQIFSNLWHDGSWKKWRTWKSAIQFIGGRYGLLRSTMPLLRLYRQKDFHPEQLGDDQLAHNWLQAHYLIWTAVA